MHRKANVNRWLSSRSETCFKMEKMREITGIFCFLLFAVMGSGQLVDRIVAVVNEEIITLTDLRIAGAFGLGFAIPGEKAELSRRDLLNRMIDRKLVAQQAPEDMLIEEEDIRARKMEIEKEMGAPPYKDALKRFGMEAADLDGFIREEIVCRRIVNRRFSRGAVISLEDIEAYYQNQYLPAQRESGKDLRPLTEILNEIEEALKRKRIEKQLQEWLGDLKEKSDIRIHEER